jgi:hypothetical protein
LCRSPFQPATAEIVSSRLKENEPGRCARYTDCIVPEPIMHHSHSHPVPKEGIEPSSRRAGHDFESCASASSATPAILSEYSRASASGQYRGIRQDRYSAKTNFCTVHKFPNGSVFRSSENDSPVLISLFTTPSQELDKLVRKGRNSEGAIYIPWKRINQTGGSI